MEEVPVWQISHEFVLLVYKITCRFPKSELYGLTSQFRRCVVSVPANISKGFYRNTTKELVQFLHISRGSLGESKYYLKLSKDLGYLSTKKHNQLIDITDNIGRQLNGWIKSLNKND